MSSQDRTQLPFILITLPSGSKASPQKGKQWKLTNVVRIDHEVGTDSILFYRSIPLTNIIGAIASGAYQGMAQLSANAQAPLDINGIIVSYPFYLAFGGGATAKAYVCALEVDDIEAPAPAPTPAPAPVTVRKGGWDF